ncbi:MAG: LacI family DNA-binding transcriptional regulator [Faecousia sp.]
MSIKAKDIAQKLGISPSAVSLAINGRPGVSVDTREKVLAEAVRMGYTSGKKSSAESGLNIRYVIFLDEGSTVRETSFYSIVLQGIESVAKKSGCNVLVSYFYAGGDWTEQIQAVSKDVDGLIVLGTEVTDAHIAQAKAHGADKLTIPMVLVDNATSIVDIDCIVSDNLRGAYQATAYLLENGHQDVGYLRSKNRIDNFDERMVGFLRARKAFGKTTEPEFIDVGISSELAFYDMCNWLDKHTLSKTALFAENDIIAAACARALKSKGYSIPEDVSIIGFDDMPISSLIDPPLTTIRVMKERMGATAMEILLRRMSSKDCALNQPRIGVFRIVLSTHLIKRESVRAI